MVSRIRLWLNTKIRIGTAMMITLAAAPWPVRAIPPAWICCSA